MATTAPLDGVQVVDLSAVGPASRCSQLLADLGAAVVKVLRPGATAPWHAYGAGRGTRRVHLDLRDDRAREAFYALVAASDVVLDSYRPGVADRLGIGYAALSQRNPRLVYAALTGYGQDGPYAGWAGHDLDYQAVAGVLALQGRRADGAPALPGATVADSAGGGLMAALAIVAALLRRERTGEGAFLDCAAVEGTLWLNSLHIDEYLATGVEPTAGGGLLLGRYACYDVYRCRDGRFVAVGALETAFFTNLCRRLGIEELAAWQYDDDRQDELRAALAERFATRDRDEWVRDLADADTCVAPVLTIAELVADPHLVARGVFTTAVHPEHGEFRQVAPLVPGSRRDPVMIAASDPRAVFAGLVPDETLDALIEEGVLA